MRASVAAVLVLLLAAPLPFSGFAPSAEAHSDDALPTQTGGHSAGVADGGFWNVVEGMATKTGYRLVFWWDADAPVAGVVEWGFSATELPNVVVPVGDAVDAAQVALFDLPPESVASGQAVHFRVRDLQTGARSPVASFPLGNAYRSDASDGAYEINLLVQLDTESLPADLPFDQALLDVARGVDVLAERTWDATDGYVRIGKVLVTDTVLDHPANVNQNGVGVCPPSVSQQGATVGNGLADFLVSTQSLLDSHTFKDGIACPGWSVYLGRVGQFASAWRDDLHVGAVMAHELGHYAFNMDDLYDVASGEGCWAGVDAPPSNALGQHDVSVMSNRFGWADGRWKGSEFDRAATPCDRQGGGVSWAHLAGLYPQVPEGGRAGDGLPDHGDSDFDRPRDNPDGGALDLFVLDNELLVSKVTQWRFAQEQAESDPTLLLAQPAEGQAVAPGVLAVSGVVDRRFRSANAPPLATLSASPGSGSAPLPVTFTLGATDGDGVVASWSLDFGDGAPLAAGTGGPPATLDHTFVGEGAYQPTLAVFDDAGASAEAAVDVAVGILAGTTRVGTDPEADTAATCGSDALPCDVAWFAGARDGLDLTALHAHDVGAAVRFLWSVRDGDAFFLDAAGDPADDPRSIAAYRLSATFRTSPMTAYAVNVERAHAESELVATLTSSVGAVSRSPVIGAASRQGDLFWADVPKSRLPETAVLRALTDLGGSSAILQRGDAVRRSSPVDVLDVVENSQLFVTGLDLPGTGANPSAILSPPDAPPAAPLLGDEVGDAAWALELTAPSGQSSAIDVESAWLDNDADYLYVGMKVTDIPEPAALDAELAYGVTFHPEWVASLPGVPADYRFAALRVEARLAPVRPGEGSAAGMEQRFDLRVLSTDGERTLASRLADLPLSRLDHGSDIVWWVVPRTLLGSPSAGELSDVSADAQHAAGAALRAGYEPADIAAATSGTFALSDAPRLLDVDAGGFHDAAVGQPEPLAATPVGGRAPYECAWSGPPEALFADAGACATTVTFAAPGEYALRIDVVDAAGERVNDTAPASVVVANGERVELEWDGARVAGASVAVATSESTPADEWATSVDLASASFGAHVLAAKWFDADGALLDEVAVTIEVTGGPPFVRLDAPADGVLVEGPVTVVGTVGHVGGPPPGAPVEETVRVHLDAVLLAELAVDADGGDDEWVALFDADTLDPGTHTVRAEYLDGRGGLAEASVVVHVPEPPDPFLTVESPAPGAPIALPVDIAGQFSTTGVVPQDESGTSEVEAHGGALPHWARSEFVRASLVSSAFHALEAQLGGHVGFLGAYPTPAGGGHVVALFEGSLPSDLPAEFDDRPIEYRAHVAPQKLERLASHGPERAVSLADVRQMGPVAFAEWAQGPLPSGPGSPGVQQQVGPGGALQALKRDDAGAMRTFVCSASFLFENPATGTYYVGTAGHCLLDASAASSGEDPAGRARSVSLCVSNCWNNGLGVGNYVTLTPEGTYHPVAFATQKGVGNDFGLIEVPEELTPFLRPWLWFWNGPTEADRPSPGDLLVHYGHGTASPAFPVQGRAAVATGSDGAAIRALGEVTNGDSGSALATAAVRSDRTLAGDGAAGTITHVTASADPALMAGTDLGRGLDLAQAALGFRPALVTEDAEIRLPSVDFALQATITDPVPGAVVDPFAGRFAEVRGTATFPAATLPGVATQTYYLHRTSCDASSVLTMTASRGAQPDPGDGCGRTFGPAGYVWEAAIGELSDAFPTDPKPATTTHLDASRRVDAFVVLSGYRAVPGNPQPVPSVVLDVEARLYAGHRLVGSERIQDERVLGPDTTVRFSFAPRVPTATPEEGLTFVFVVHQADGPVYVRYGGPMGSSVRLPIGVSPGNRVEVSVDDPSFTTGLLSVSGDESWSAPWDLQGVAPGLHRLYARALQDDEAQGAAAQRDVTVSSVLNPPVAGFSPSIVGRRVEFTDASLAGDLPIASYRWTFGDGATSSERNPVHTFSLGGRYEVRLVVTDEGGYADDARLDIQVGHEWALEARIVGALGAEVVPWTAAAEPVDGLADEWSLRWDPDPLPPNGVYAAEARLVRDGLVVDTDDLALLLRVNHPPVLDPIGAQAVAEGQSLAFQATASDADGDAVTYSATGLPTGAALSASGLFQWSPSFAAAGAYAVTVRASDAFGAFDDEAFTVTVADTNRAPVWAAAAPRTVRVGNFLNFVVGASDADGQPLTFGIVASPPGLGVTFTATDALLRWTPLPADVGAHLVTLSVTDGLATAETSVLVTVLADEPPVARIAGPQTLEVGPATYDGRASTDPEGRPLAFAWQLAQGESILVTGTASTFPVTFAAPGDYEVRLTVRDAQGQTATAVRVVRVDDHLLLALTPLSDEGDEFAPLEHAVVRACATWARDGAAAVGASVEVTSTAEANGGALPDPTAPRASGSTDAAGCVDLELPFDAVVANVPGPHRVDGVVTSASRPGDALVDDETDSATAHYVVMP